MVASFSITISLEFAVVFYIDIFSVSLTTQRLKILAELPDAVHVRYLSLTHTVSTETGRELLHFMSVSSLEVTAGLKCNKHMNKGRNWKVFKKLTLGDKISGRRW